MASKINGSKIIQYYMVLLNNDGLGVCLLVSLWKVKLLGLILGHGIVVRFTCLLAYVLCWFTCIMLVYMYYLESEQERKCWRVWVLIGAWKTLEQPKMPRRLGGVWFVFSNNNFQFLNSISRISTHFFTHTYFHKCF